MSHTDIFTTIIAPNVVVVHIRELSRRLGKQDLDGMFQTPLYTAGVQTHWISSGYIRPAYINAMTDSIRLFNVAKKAWQDDGDVFPFSQAQVTNALTKCTVLNGTNEDAYAMIAQLGLTIGVPE